MIKTETQYALRQDLRADPNQPRKDFPATEFAAHMEDIRANGILESLVVRPDPDKKTKWLIVDGERRWRVAAALKLDRVPIAPREFADEAAVRTYQRIVGTQRLNLSDLERAASLDSELKARQKADAKFSITQLGEHLGIPRATIYESFKLLKCSAPVVAALKAGTIDASKARCFATVPAAEHPELLKWATEERYGNPPPSVRALEKHIAEEYCRQLSAAPFDQKAAYLSSVGDVRAYKKNAGAMETLPVCTTCPKRSGNIEGMGGNPHVCTDVACYAAKQAAHTAKVLKEAEAAGGRAVSAEVYAKKKYSEFTDAEDEVWEAKGRPTLAALGKKHKVAPIVTVDEDGKVIEVFTRDEAAKLKQLAGIKPDAYQQKEKAQTKARQKREKLYRAAAVSAVPLVLDKLVKVAAIPTDLWPLVCAGAYHALDIDRHDFVAKRHGLSERVNDSRAALKKWLGQKHPAAEYAAMTVELLCLSDWEGGGWHEVKWSKVFETVCKLAGVNLEKLLKTAEKPKTKPSPAKKPEPAKKATQHKK